MKKKVIVSLTIVLLCGFFVCLVIYPNDWMIYGMLIGTIFLLLLLVLRILSKRGKRLVSTVPDPGISEPNKNKSSFAVDGTVKTSYFENFIHSYNGQAEDTRIDVESIWERMTILLDPNRPSPQPNTDNEDSGGYVEYLPTLMNSPDGCGRVSGLVIGRVQSGKTRNYVGLILKAFDEKWNTVLVMTSNNKMLARQTWNRLLGTGDGEGDLYNRGKANVVAMSKLDRNSDSGEIEFSWCLGEGEWREGNLYVGVIQKEDDHFKQVERWLKTVGKIMNGELAKKMRLLIIDDEADNATPDSSIGTRDLSFTDTDVLQLAKGIGDAAAVSKWVESLPEMEIDPQLAKDFLKGFANPYKNVGDFKKAALDPTGKLYGILGFPEMILVEGGKVELGDLVGRYFEGRRTRNNPIRNAKTFVALVLYVLEFVPQRSTINRYICKLVSRMENDPGFAFSYDKMAYIGYTATPYANMLNEIPTRDPLAADFMKSLQVSKEYFGLERLHGEDPARRIDIVREIPAADEINAVTPITDYDWVDAADNGIMDDKPDVEGDLTVTHEDEEGKRVRHEWRSMKQAIAWLFCAAAARRILRGNRPNIADRWTTMIINVSHEISVHGKLREWLSAYIKYIATHKTDFLENCKQIWEEETKSGLTLAKFREQCPDYGELDNDNPDWYPQWDQIDMNVKWFLSRWINNIHVIELNSTPEGKRWQLEYKTGEASGVTLREDNIWIVCGGNTISRGLTLDGLVVSYFDRVGANSHVDTITQMGRWFGYRKGYELLPRVWMTAIAKKEMVSIAKTERDMHKDLVRKFDTGISPKNPAGYAVIKYLGIRLTGRDAAMALTRNGGVSDYFNWIQTNAAGKMVDIVLQLIDHRERGHHINDAAYSWQWQGRRPCHCYKDLNAVQIVSFLEKMKGFYANQDRDYIEGLTRSIGRSPAWTWDVVIENPNNRREVDDEYGVAEGRVGIAYSFLHNSINSGTEYRLKTQSYGAWFADISNATIAMAECDLVENELNARLDIAEGEKNTIRKEIATVRNAVNNGRYADERLGFKIRQMFKIDKGSSEAYRAAVYKKAGKTNPVLHITFARVLSEGDKVASAPVVLLAYFWPNHHPDVIASPVAEPGVSYGDVTKGVCECFREERHIISVDQLVETIKKMYDGAPVSEGLVRSAIQSRKDLSILIVPEEEELLRNNQIVYKLPDQGRDEPIDDVRWYLAGKIKDHFGAVYRQRGYVNCKAVYDWLLQECPGCINENNAFRAFECSTWLGLLRAQGIKAVQEFEMNEIFGSVRFPGEGRVTT